MTHHSHRGSSPAFPPLPRRDFFHQLSGCGLGFITAGLSGRLIGWPNSAQTPKPVCTTVQENGERWSLRILNWNIWHGGREDGQEVGPARVRDIIRASEADVVCLQETYGSGEWLAQQLGFHFLPRGTNVSLLSRHPWVEEISVGPEFQCVGGIVELPTKQRVAVYSVWLPYAEDIWLPDSRAGRSAAECLAACQPSQAAWEVLGPALEQRLQEMGNAELPIIVAGDFNSMSALDYREVHFDQFSYAIEWPVSQWLLQADFRDAYRELHPAVNRATDRTWSPRFPEQIADRIDFVYFRGRGCEVRVAEHWERHPAGERFPSDHAAVLVELAGGAVVEHSASSGRAASYNIRHCRGADQQVDLERTATVLQSLAADVIGLQEVDWLARRSGGVNQAAELGERLNCHAAFAPFMDFEGGRYGLAILSRYPIVRTETIPLPTGGEPRVALAAEVRWPSGQRVLVVNLHLDWIADDAVRFRQAQAVEAYLRTAQLPYLLLGDFNDQLGSRTLDLLAQGRRRADPGTGELAATYPAEQPTAAIDFIWGGPAGFWSFANTVVVAESNASDHLPLVTDFQLTISDPQAKN